MTAASSEIKAMMDEATAAQTPLTAEDVVEKAKDEQAWPALNHFLWQTPEAALAAEARLQRAHHLLLRIRVTNEEGYSTRMFVHTLGTPGYQALTTVANSIDLARTRILALSQDISRARARLRSFRSFLPTDVSEEIDQALERAEARAAEAAQERSVSVLREVPPNQASA